MCCLFIVFASPFPEPLSCLPLLFLFLRFLFLRPLPSYLLLLILLPLLFVLHSTANTPPPLPDSSFTSCSSSLFLHPPSLPPHSSSVFLSTVYTVHTFSPSSSVFCSSSSFRQSPVGGKTEVDRFLGDLLVPSAGRLSCPLTRLARRRTGGEGKEQEQTWREVNRERSGT